MSQNGLDPRGPRFGAGITSLLMVLVIYLSLDPKTELIALGILALSSVMFVFGTVLGPARHPYSYLYRKLLLPRLKPPTELEDPRPVRFAQLIGLLVTATGTLLGALGIANAMAIAAAIAFIAAFLNASFAFCLGCLLYIGLKRIGFLGSSKKQNTAR